MKTFIKKITWLQGMQHGYGNGYVIIPKGHPDHGKDYNEIDVAVHGGLTFGEAASELDWPEILEEDKEGYVVGFDTAHYNDNQINWPIGKVIQELEDLKTQLLAHA